jgi:hypothetical protein
MYEILWYLTKGMNTSNNTHEEWLDANDLQNSPHCCSSICSWLSNCVKASFGGFEDLPTLGLMLALGIEGVTLKYSQSWLTIVTLASDLPSTLLTPYLNDYKIKYDEGKHGQDERNHVQIFRPMPFHWAPLSNIAKT